MALLSAHDCHVCNEDIRTECSCPECEECGKVGLLSCRLNGGDGCEDAIELGDDFDWLIELGDEC